MAGYILYAQEAGETESTEPSDSAQETAAPAATPSPANAVASEEPTTVSEIVVTARYNFCDPEVMQRRLPSSTSLKLNFVELPGHKFSGESTSRNPNFFDAGTETTRINNLDYTAQKFEIRSSYLSCAPQRCAELKAEFSSLNLERELRFGLGDYEPLHNYSVYGEVEFSQMYNAKWEDVEVSCPLSTCQGIIFYGRQSRHFYYVTRVGDRLERKLVVNGGLGSHFTTEGTGTTLERCPPVETPAPPSAPSRRRR